ncbi:Ubiquitin carboxyl-terminal hydrolase [Mycena sanguinolenta]|uniref:Ubiquitin carboxyl-terminal hydrolase n=1 Tax=Mycena sanguinolenta TaxID=230812 RepID=A0A8H6Z379_9AGAR|nr:Ubiquitin carboxyl-terminal hydrolase [Mycena sanguinolenta]
MSGIQGCPHIGVVATGDVTTGPLRKFKDVVTWDVRRVQSMKNAAATRKKTPVPTCGTCQIALHRPFVCLHCSYAGCWNNNHVSTHLQDSQHSFCADVKSGSIFCVECRDFIYHPKIDELYLAAVVSAEEQETRFQVTKKPRERFQSWVPTAPDVAALDNSVTIPCQGRRGLLNLGQTCFMNVILQSFVHNPLLRNYFLGDKHNHKQCKLEEDCTCCEMDKLFAEIFSDEPTAYGPVTFLITTWRKSAELAGYQQQDAHEFFISTLNHIHSTSRGSTNVSCNCIIHSTFAGQLQSDVICERCNNVTSTVDPMLDISLELRGKAGEAAATENTLTGCLKRYTQPEKLGPKQYSCSKCGKAAHEVSKRLSIRKLPPVLSFQFKRFEQKADKSAARKIDTRIRFPATLNMAPFTTIVMKAAEKENNGPPFSYPGPPAIFEYDLFAVINHEGQINNGHYTNYARYEDEWYRFDDTKVTPASLGSVLASHAYMCFYVKRHLDYKPYTTPTYVLTRENEVVREKEMEREKELARIKEVEEALLATV